VDLRIVAWLQRGLSCSKLKILACPFSLSYVSPCGLLTFWETVNPRTHRSATGRMAFWMITLLACGWAVPSFAELPSPPNDRVYRQPIDDLNAIREHLLLADPADRGHLRFLTLSHLVNNPRITEQDLSILRSAVSKLMNSLSWQSQISSRTQTDLARCESHEPIR